MSNKGWFNLESASSTATGLIPDNQFFEGDSAFSQFKLSKTTRLYGFAGSTIGGFVLSLLGVILLILGSIISFALMYGLGTIVSLIGTGFIIGFAQQLKLMFKTTRIIASIIFLGSVAMIFVGAFVIGSGLLCIILVIVQFLAYTWYTLSYIPYARTAVMSVFKRTAM
ncbi:hypothetical protein M0805_008950 [Coniferiporia weirii]|nr:hypothetical protein M0805_008950 [Coniferiporia weirii]